MKQQLYLVRPRKACASLTIRGCDHCPHFVWIHDHLSSWHRMVEVRDLRWPNMHFFRLASMSLTIRGGGHCTTARTLSGSTTPLELTLYGRGTRSCVGRTRSSSGWQQVSVGKESPTWDLGDRSVPTKSGYTQEYHQRISSRTQRWLRNKFLFSLNYPASKKLDEKVEGYPSTVSTTEG